MKIYLHFRMKLDLLLRDMEVNLLAAFYIMMLPIFPKFVWESGSLPGKEFIENVCIYIVIAGMELERLAALIGCEAEALQETEAAVQLLKQWMYQKGGERTDYVSGFLHKVDDFDLEQYIRAIHFDSLRVPKVPFTLPVSKHYYGLSEMRDGELDFLKHTVLAKSMEPVYLCSDMPVEDMAADEELQKVYVRIGDGAEERASYPYHS
ncbi:MAG: hypothetical protein ACLU3N_09425 [Lachnospiraceae bacterium]